MTVIISRMPTYKRKSMPPMSSAWNPKKTISEKLMGISDLCVTYVQDIIAGKFALPL